MARGGLERLARYVLRPPLAKERLVRQVLYHRVFAARHAWRKEVVPKPELFWRVFGEDGWRRPGCGGEMRLRSVVVDTPATPRILAGLRATGPP